MQPCIWCAESINADAAVCRYCQRPQPAGLTGPLLWRGPLYGLGRITAPDGSTRLASWNLATGGSAINSWPDDAQSYDNAVDHLQRVQAFAAADAYHGNPMVRLVSTLGTVLVLFVIYVVIHMARYHGCLASPSLFAWPSSCF